jgi:propanol-preferring alcohol dehydrogenase
MTRMQAMVLEAPGRPLALADRPDPAPGPGQLLLDVAACGVCRTDLHLLDGEVQVPRLPVVLGHQIVGRVRKAGPGAAMRPGTRVGVPWLGWTCGSCRFCTSNRENLCIRARFTGRDIHGGYAEHAVADARYCLRLPEGLDDLDAAPLLCGGLIGYRALRLAGDAQRLGIYGFGAAAHLIAQVALWQGRRVFAFTRAGDEAGQEFARSLGVEWAGASGEAPPEPLDAALVFAPVGALVLDALRASDRGATIVCAGIHMSDLPPIPYADLWQERSIRSVANLTRHDGEEFLRIADEVPVRSTVTRYALEDANQALDDLRHGRFEGAAVLEINAQAGRAAGEAS